jgi:hypothetical protein
MWPFRKKKDLSTRVLLTDELVRLHGLMNNIYARDWAAREITKINEHLLLLDKKDHSEKIPERIKGLESTMQEVLMMGHKE